MTEGRSVLHARRTQPTMVDYPGRMAALFYTAGCNFRCGFCHNAELFDASLKTYAWDELEDMCRRFKKEWVDAISITGGEPTIHDRLPETVNFFKQKGFHIKLDTNGSNPAMLETLLPSLDYVAMDIKCSLASYPAVTACDPSLRDALRRSIALIMAKAKDYEFRTTLIESLHTDEELQGCGELIRGAKLYILQPFVPRDNLPDENLRDGQRTRPSFLEHAKSVVEGYVNCVQIR